MGLKVFDFRREEDVRNVLVTPHIRSRFFRLEPGREAKDFHSHDLGHEIFLILQGRCLFEIDGEEAELGPGQMCIALADQPHRVTVIGDEPVIMYLSVTPHIVPTHTGRTLDGGRRPHLFSRPENYDSEGDSEAPSEELIDRFRELAQSASNALLASARKAGDLKQAAQSENAEQISDARKKVWDDLLAAFQNIYDLGEVWNNLAPRAGQKER